MSEQNRIVKHEDYLYRFVAAHGVERKGPRYGEAWYRIHPSTLASFTADELRAVADAMDGGKERADP